MRPLQITDAVGIRAFLSGEEAVAFSPDSSLIAYTLCDPRNVPASANGRADSDIRSFTAGCAVWVIPRAGGDPVKVEHEGGAWAPSWSPDGRWLAFFGNDPDGAHLWVWERETRQVRRISAETVDTGIGLEIPAWTRDSRQVIARLPAPDNAAAKYVTTTFAVANDSAMPWVAPGRADSTVRVSQSGAVTPISNEAPPPYTRVRLAALNVESGDVARLAEGAIAYYWPSPDGKWVAFTRYKSTPFPNALSHRWDVNLVELATGHVHTVATADQIHAASVRWAPDSGALAYFSGPGKKTGASGYVVELNGSAPRLMSGPASFGTTVSNVPLWDVTSEYVFAIDGHTLWGGKVSDGRFSRLRTWHDYELLYLSSSGDSSGTDTAREGRGAGAGRERDCDAKADCRGTVLYISARNQKTKRVELLRVDAATGAVRVLGDEKLSIGENSSFPVFSANGRFVAYLGQSSDRPEELFVASRDFSNRKRLTRINPELETYRYGTSRIIDFRSRDGTPLKATLLLPAGYIPGRRYPMVTWVYGGLYGSNWAHRFGVAAGMNTFNLQMLSTRGYVVLVPDMPLRQGEHVQSLMDAVMPAVDTVIDQGIADAERLAVMGQSAGGYGTLALITQTNRFKAAIMCAGFGELASFYGHGWGSWLESGDGAIGAAPWEAPERYVRNSPVYFLNRVETPLMIQVGADDRVVKDFPSHVFAELRVLNKPAVYLSYGGEGHLLRSYPNLIDFWSRVAAFLEHFLRPETSSEDHGRST